MCSSILSDNAVPMCWIANFRASFLADVVSIDSFNADTFERSRFNKVITGITIEKNNRKGASTSNQIEEESFDKVNEVQHLKS